MKISNDILEPTDNKKKHKSAAERLREQVSAIRHKQNDDAEVETIDTEKPDLRKPSGVALSKPVTEDNKAVLDELDVNVDEGKKETPSVYPESNDQPIDDEPMPEQPETQTSDEPESMEPKDDFEKLIESKEAEDDNEPITLKKPVKKHAFPKKTILIGGAIVIVLGLIIGGVALTHGHSKSASPATSSTSVHSIANSSSKSVIKDMSDVKDKLKSSAKVTGQPYKVKTTALGGGYTLGVITYYPDDSAKTYMDFSITAPSKPDAPTTDDKAQKIEKDLKSSLPTINKTITVIDGSKVTMATYKQSDDTYQTILMYDKQPFGFVSTDKDGNMVNNVTTYYIQKVQKNN